MYAKSLHIYDFKCFRKAEMKLQYPGRTGTGVPEIDNVNLILGDNGGGKSSILRALAIAALAPTLLESGFVPYRLARRAGANHPPVEKTLLKIVAQATQGETPPERPRGKKFELLARIEQRPRGNLDRLHLDSTPDSPIVDLIYDDYSPTFFIVGYGATRRVETGGYFEGSAQKARGLRYQRVAGLFEDHVALRPLQAWAPKLRATNPIRFEEVTSLINQVLPQGVRFTGEQDPEDEQFIFDFEGVPTPFSALSDGYKAFIGWVGDLVAHLADVAPPDSTLNRTPGIVLVDEIDLHLHPAWQRAVVPTLARTFPKLQFVFTSHSPLVAGTMRKENVFITSSAEDGTATIKQLEERVYGRSAEQLLLSSYFGLTTTRPDAFQSEADALFRRAAEGEAEAALTFLDRLSGGAEDQRG